MIVKECVITVKVGLHARPANEFSAIAKAAPFEVLFASAFLDGFEKRLLLFSERLFLGFVALSRSTSSEFLRSFSTA